MPIDRVEIEKRILRSLRTLGPGPYMGLLRKVLVEPGDSSPETRLLFNLALKDLCERGAIECDHWHYRMPEGRR